MKKMFRTTALYVFVIVFAASLCLMEGKQTIGGILRTGGTYDAPLPRDPTPCKIEECGPCPEGEINFSPNPPEVDKDMFVNISLIAPADIWYLTTKGNISIEGSIVRRFDENLCDLKKDTCPIKKGEKMEYSDHFLLSSILVKRTKYSAYVEMTNQDDVPIGCYFVKDCLFI